LVPSTTTYITPKIIPEAQNAVLMVTSSPEWIKRRISYYADFYGVSEITMNHIIRCESGYNPEARNLNEKEDSNGLVQINLKAHEITLEQARDIEFSLDFLARNLRDGKGFMWTCWNTR